MKKLFLISLFSLLATVSLSAEEYGDDKTVCPFRYFVTSGVVPVRDSPSMYAKTLWTVSGGDIIYTDTEEKINGSDMKWIQISGMTGYIEHSKLTKEVNPNYIIPKNYKTREDAAKHQVVFGTFNLPIWLLITLLVIFSLLVLFRCIHYIPSTAKEESETPRGFMGKIAQRITSKLHSVRKTFPRFTGYYLFPNWDQIKKEYLGEGFDKELGSLGTKKFIKSIYGNGMKKLFFFSPAPYLFFIQLAVIILGAFAMTLLISFFLGGIIWLGCTFIGGISPSVGEWGQRMFETFNVIGLSIYLAKSYWKAALIVALTPLVLFLVIAILFYFFAFILIFIEKRYLRAYNANTKNACPNCQRPSEPARYLSHDIPLPVNLQPGPWGLFHIIHPVTGEKMPTLFINGKARLERNCKNCHKKISAEIGVEKHIGVAGIAQSGKTALLYRIISEFQRKTIGREHIAHLIDDMGEEDTIIRDFLSNAIEEGGEMQWYPYKTAETRHKSIQMRLYNAKSPFPYRLYVNDVAGEMFTSENSNDEDAAFLQNTDLLIFTIDPFTMKVSQLDLSNSMKKWYEENVGTVKDTSGKVDIKEALHTLSNLIGHYRNRGEKDRMSVMLTLVKTDAGYLGDIDKNNPQSLRQFLIEELGLESAIWELENTSEFKEVSFYAVSAHDAVCDSGIRPFMDEMLKKMNISFDGVSEDAVKEDNKRAEEIHSKIEAENQRFMAQGKSPKKKKSEIAGYPTKLGVIVTFSLIAIALSVWAFCVEKTHKENYEIVMGKVNAIMNQEPEEAIEYNKAIDIIEQAVSDPEMRFGDKYEGLLTGKAGDIRKKHLDLEERYLSLLRNNFIGEGQNKSNIEVCAQYKALDTLRQVKDIFKKMEMLSPENEEYLQYKQTFEQLLRNYRIQL